MIHYVNAKNYTEGKMYTLKIGFPDEFETVTALYRGGDDEELSFWVNGESWNLIRLYHCDILESEEVEVTEVTEATKEAEEVFFDGSDKSAFIPSDTVFTSIIVNEHDTEPCYVIDFYINGILVDAVDDYRKLSVLIADIELTFTFEELIY